MRLGTKGSDVQNGPREREKKREGSEGKARYAGENPT